jgi:hypothetical protein
VLTLSLYLLLLWFGLTAILAAWTLWFQAYIYSEAVEKIWWRAPAAGGALSVFFLLWVWLDYGTTGRYRGLLEVSFRQDQEPYKEMTVESEGGRKETYKRATIGRGEIVYFKDGHADSGRMPTRPQKIIVTENGQQVVFEPERDAKGKFLIRTNESLRYVNKETGRVMVEGQLGKVSTFRWWWLFSNLFVNLLHFVAWGVCLWLLLKFQFWHSFGMAMAAWLAMTLFVLPPLLTLAEETGQARTTVKVE